MVEQLMLPLWLTEDFAAILKENGREVEAALTEAFIVYLEDQLTLIKQGGKDAEIQDQTKSSGS